MLGWPVFLLPFFCNNERARPTGGEGGGDRLLSYVRATHTHTLASLRTRTGTGAGGGKDFK